MNDFTFNLVKTNFKYNTISTNNHSLEIIPKKKGFFGKESFDEEKFHEAINLLFDQMSCSSEKITNTTGFIQVVKKLNRETLSIKSPVKAYEIQQKISRIVHTVLIQNWNDSDQTMDETIQTKDFEDWRNIFKNELLTKNMSVMNDTLLIDLEFLSKLLPEEREEVLHKHIENVLNKYPEVRAIQIQGNYIITREQAKNIIDQELPFTSLLTLEDGHVKYINPMLFSQSEYFRGLLDLKKRGTDKSEIRVNLPELDSEALSSINFHAGNIEAIKVEPDLEEKKLLHAADYLQVDHLLQRYDQALRKNLELQAKELIEPNELWEWALTQAADPINNLPKTRSLINNCLEKHLIDLDVENLKNNLSVLKERKIVLNSLEISLEDLTDKDFEQILEKCPYLNALILKGCHSLSADAIKTISEKFPLLSELNLINCQFDDTIGPSLSNLTKLKSLNLSKCPITDEIGPYLSNLTELKTLNLSKCPITDEIAPHLEKMNRLQQLNLSECDRLTDGIGPHLEKLTDLQQLNLRDCYRLTNAFGAHLETLINLQRLDLSQNSQITSDIGRHLEKLINLQLLNLRRCSEISSEIGQHIEHLTNLQVLDLSACFLINDAIGPHLEKLINLQRLNLSECDELTNTIGFHLEKLINLQELNLSQCPRLSNEIGIHLEKLVYLEQLNLYRNTKITEVIKSHLAKLPLLKKSSTRS